MKFQTIGKAALPFAIMAGLGMSSAQAADLGGDCCADLEERIAELEATTARKGNRRVSLKISGHVNQAVMWWDNGVESNTYVVDNAASSTRFRLTGSANINADVSAGYTIEIGTYMNRSNGVGEGSIGSDSLGMRKSFWYLRSKSLGTLSVGAAGFATGGVSEIGFHNGFATSEYNNGGMAGAIELRTVGGALIVVAGNNATNGTLALDGDPLNSGFASVVKYASPTIAGFTVSAAWGDDDTWDAALRFANTFGDFRLAAGIGYLSTSATAVTVNDITSLAMSAAIMHTPTGLFVSGQYSQQDQDNVGGYDPSKDNWGVVAGISKKFTSLGTTQFYGEYVVRNGWDNAAGLENTATSWGIGLEQGIDAAAMTLYLGYTNTSYTNDVGVGTALAGTGIQDHSRFLMGGKINF